MKGIQSAAAAAAMILAAPAAAMAQCPPVQAPYVAVSTALPQPRVVTTEPRARIARMLGQQGSPSSIPQGVTSAQRQLSVSASMTMREVARGQWCAWPTKVDVAYGFSQPPTAYVAAELRPGSCAHEAVMRHELEHVAIHVTEVRGAESTIRQAVEEAARVLPARASTAEAAKAVAYETLMLAAKRATFASQASADARNAALDTPQSYRALTASCSDWR